MAAAPYAVTARTRASSVAQWRAVGGGTGTSLPRDALEGMMLVGWIEWR